MGCTVGPSYRAPERALPERFVEASSSGASRAGDDAWWTEFGDDTLNRIMAAAISLAPDIKEAQARVREARALWGVAAAAQYPSADASAAYERSHGSTNVPIGVAPGGLGPGMDSNVWQAGFDASWEIDLFGGRRRAAESAGNQYEAAVATVANVQLSLLAEVARNYMQLRGAQRELAVAQENVAAQRDVLELSRTLLSAGLASSLDVLRAQAQVAATEAAIPGFQAEIRISIYRIGALAGRPPENLLNELESERPIPLPADAVPVGLPSELLLRRPDVWAAERRIAAANARIGVATADLYPHFSLIATAGLESLNSSDFLSAPSRYFSVGPSISWLIFDANAVRFRISAEQARTDAAVAEYQRTVLDALRDVESSLVTYARTIDRWRSLRTAAQADWDAVQLAERLYRRGLTDFLAVLDAERSLYSAQDELARDERDTALARVSLYKALGGGWLPQSPK
jgi:outer membrane protein, multidrug efflux system